ncbi:hypothetical protein X975_01482, partial [Stegodyphus mimosarum]
MQPRPVPDIQRETRPSILRKKRQERKDFNQQKKFKQERKPEAPRNSHPGAKRKRQEPKYQHPKRPAQRGQKRKPMESQRSQRRRLTAMNSLTWTEFCEKRMTEFQASKNHIKSDHTDINLEYENKVFTSKIEFEHWKEMMEQNAQSSFIISSSKKAVKVGTASYYQCHRSGRSKIKESRKVCDIDSATNVCSEKEDFAIDVSQNDEQIEEHYTITEEMRRKEHSDFEKEKEEWHAEFQFLTSHANTEDKKQKVRECLKTIRASFATSEKLPTIPSSSECVSEPVNKFIKHQRR